MGLRHVVDAILELDPEDFDLTDLRDQGGDVLVAGVNELLDAERIPKSRNHLLNLVLIINGRVIPFKGLPTQYQVSVSNGFSPITLFQMNIVSSAVLRGFGPLGWPNQGIYN